MTADRAGYIAGLRALADHLDSTPDLPLPDSTSFNWYLFGAGLRLDEQKGKAAYLVRLIGGEHRKVETSDLFRFVREWGGFETQVIVDRPAVCEKVVVGTREVEVEEDACPKCEGPVELTPSGALTCREHGSEHYRAEPPARRKVAQTVEDSEWRCAPLLADRADDREQVSA